MKDSSAAVPWITPERAKEMIAGGNAVVVDVRERPELIKSGKVAGAVHVPCGSIQVCADPQTPYYNDAFDKSKAMILYCAAGERSAFGGAILRAMGYTDVYNLGGFDDWVASGGPVETVG